MAKRLFPQITRQGAARLAKHDQAYVSESLYHQGLKPFRPSVVTKWRRQMGLDPHDTPRKILYQPVKNGQNDALSITCVLDLLLRIDHDSYVYPAGVTKLLRDEYGHLVQYDPYTVGRIFSDLLAAMPPGLEHDEQPLATVHWGGARQLVVRADSLPAWQWLGLCRDLMGDRAESDQREAREGNPVPRTPETWNVLDAAEWGKAP